MEGKKKESHRDNSEVNTSVGKGIPTRQSQIANTDVETTNGPFDDIAVMERNSVKDTTMVPFNDIAVVKDGSTQVYFLLYP